MTNIAIIIASQRAFFVNRRLLAYCVAASTRPTNHASTHEWTHATTNRIDNKSVTNLCRRWHSRQPATQSRRRVKGSKVSSRWLLPSPIKQRKEKLIKKWERMKIGLFLPTITKYEYVKKIRVHQIPIQLLLRTQGIVLGRPKAGRDLRLRLWPERVFPANLAALQSNLSLFTTQVLFQPYWLHSNQICPLQPEQVCSS